jgi:hypothetical protein
MLNKGERGMMLVDPAMLSAALAEAGLPQTARAAAR